MINKIEEKSADNGLPEDKRMIAYGLEQKYRDRMIADGTQKLCKFHLPIGAEVDIGGKIYHHLGGGEFKSRSVDDIPLLMLSMIYEGLPDPDSPHDPSRIYAIELSDADALPKTPYPGLDNSCSAKHLVYHFFHRDSGAIQALK